MTPPRRTCLMAVAVAGAIGDSSAHFHQSAIVVIVRRVILDGAVPPGTPISLSEVAASFKVSVIPIREALKTLVGEGLVTHRVNGGYFVAQLTTSELAELYEVRGALEQTALARAVMTRTDHDIAAAQSAHRQMQLATQPSIATKYSRDFHDALVRPSAMPRLLGIFSDVWNMTEPSRLMEHVQPEVTLELVDDHALMLRHFTDGAVEPLLAVAQAHNQRLLNALRTARDLT